MQHFDINSSLFPLMDKLYINSISLSLNFLSFSLFIYPKIILLFFSLKKAIKSVSNLITIDFASRSLCSVNDQINFNSSSVISSFFNINSKISLDLEIICV